MEEEGGAINNLESGGIIPMLGQDLVSVCATVGGTGVGGGVGVGGGALLGMAALDPTTPRRWVLLCATNARCGTAGSAAEAAVAACLRERLLEVGARPVDAHGL